MSQLFSAYHAIGLYSQEVPFSILSRGKQHLIATAVDDSFHLYSLESLQLLYVGYGGSGPTEADYIQRILFHNGRLYVAQGVNIRVWKNGRIICRHETELPATLLMGCGDRMLSVEEEGSVRVWECGDGDNWGEEYLHIEFDASVFKTTSIVHPATYVNKVSFILASLKSIVISLRRFCLGVTRDLCSCGTSERTFSYTSSEAGALLCSPWSSPPPLTS